MIDERNLQPGDRSPDLVIGLDQGTTGNTVLVVDRDLEDVDALPLGPVADAAHMALGGVAAVALPGRVAVGQHDQRAGALA